MSKAAKTTTILVSLVLSIILLIVISGKVYKGFLKRAYPIEYSQYVETYSKEYNVNPEVIYSVIRTESSFNEKAESKAGAIGLMQVTPDTFKWLQLYTKEKYEDESYLYNPEINIKYGTYYLSMLYDKYNSEEAIFCAYNSGIGKVENWLKDPEVSPDGININYIPYPETREYVKRVKQSIVIYKKLYFNND